MRQRDEALLAVGVLIGLGVVAGLIGKSRDQEVSQDERPSTFLAGPGGARGLLDATVRLGIPVRRFRERTVGLARLADGTRQVLFVLDPTFSLSPPDVSAILGFGRHADLVLAGEGAEPLLKCFGFKTRRRFLDSLPVAPPGHAPGPQAPWVYTTLVPTNQSVVVDSSRAEDVSRMRCDVPDFVSADTLLVTSRGQIAAIRLGREDGHSVLLAGDPGLFRNRALRSSEAGPFALGLVAGRYDRVIFEEYHHGFGAAGSLAGAVVAWSRRSPWGWMVWQAMAVGLLALLFGAIRFGVARPAIPRTRRSPLEHVGALATALSAAHGHDVAIGAIVRGLRRRLSPPALRARGDWRQWLTQLDRSARSPGGRNALAKLELLTRPGQPSTAVLRAANAVEDLWEDLRP